MLEFLINATCIENKYFYGYMSYVLGILSRYFVLGSLS